MSRQRPDDVPLGPHGDVRVEVARFLGPTAFPGDAHRIQEAAADNQATPEVREILSHLDDSRTYDSVEEVIEATVS